MRRRTGLARPSGDEPREDRVYPVRSESKPSCLSARVWCRGRLSSDACIATAQAVVMGACAAVAALAFLASIVGLGVHLRIAAMASIMRLASSVYPTDVLLVLVGASAAWVVAAPVTMTALLGLCAQCRSQDDAIAAAHLLGVMGHTSLGLSYAAAVALLFAITPLWSELGGATALLVASPAALLGAASVGSLARLGRGVPASLSWMLTMHSLANGTQLLSFAVGAAALGARNVPSVLLDLARQDS